MQRDSVGNVVLQRSEVERGGGLQKRNEWRGLFDPALIPGLTALMDPMSQLRVKCALPTWTASQ